MGITSFAGRLSSRPGQLVYEGEDGIMGNQGNLMFTVAYGGLTNSGIDRAIALHRTMVQNFPAGYVHFMVTRLGAPIPSGPERDRLSKMSREFAHHILASAMVIEGNALWTSTVRIALSAMSLARVKAQPRQFFVTPREGLAWLEKTAGDARQFRADEVLLAIGRAAHAAAHVA